MLPTLSFRSRRAGEESAFELRTEQKADTSGRQKTSALGMTGEMVRRLANSLKPMACERIPTDGARVNPVWATVNIAACPCPRFKKGAKRPVLIVYWELVPNFL